MNNLNWLYNIKERVNHFLNEMQENDFEYFKYSYSGDIYSKKDNWGLGNLVFATKILFTTGQIDNLSPIKKENLYRSIIRFSNSDGYISDPLITQLSILDKIKLKHIDKIITKRIDDIKRAETRQSFVALLLLGKKPNKIFSRIPQSPEDVDNYLSSFDWRTPWDAASHFSHLIFFLKMNTKLFNYQGEKNLLLINHALRWISKIQSKDDGCWYYGKNIPLNEKINGALKIMTGLHAAGIDDFPYPKKIIDTALCAINDSDACGNFNISYLLYSCNLIEPEYRKTEIENFFINRINIYKQFYHPEIGGFSFYKDKAIDIYYGKKISSGKNEPDIHGTNMFITGLAIIGKVIDIGIDLKIPIN
jgi:hypothetical protein